MSDKEQPPPFPKLKPIDPTEPDTSDYSEIETQLAAIRAEHQPLIEEYKKLEEQARAADAGLLEPRLLAQRIGKADFTSRPLKERA